MTWPLAWVMGKLSVLLLRTETHQVSWWVEEEECVEVDDRLGWNCPNSRFRLVYRRRSSIDVHQVSRWLARDDHSLPQWLELHQKLVSFLEVNGHRWWLLGKGYLLPKNEREAPWVSAMKGDPVAERAYWDHLEEYGFTWEW